MLTHDTVKVQVEEILENDEEPIEGGTDAEHLTEFKTPQ